MKILITGGNGFIARSLYESFTNCYFFPLERSIVAPTRQELDLLDHEKVRDYLNKGEFDVVIHSATYDAVPSFSHKSPSNVLDNNLKMFFNIVGSSDMFGKMIYFGSGAEAGRDNWIPNMDESYIERQTPTDEYGRSKKIMNSYTKIGNNIYNLRLFGVFGKFDDWRYRFLSNACCKAVLDMPIFINKNSVFDYLYIDDLVKVVKWIIDCNPKRKSYNVCSGKAYSYKALAEKVLGASGKTLDIRIKDDSNIVEYSGDSTLLLSENPEFKFNDLDDSVSSLYNWYNSNRGLINTSLFEY